MYVGASIFSAILLHKVYLFQTLPEFAKVKEGSIYDFLQYSLPFGVAFTVLSLSIQVFDLAIHYFFDDLCAQYYIN